MRRLLYVIIALLTLTVVASCIDRPDYVLDESQMVDVLVDVHRAEGLLEIQHINGVHPDENERYQREVMAAVLQKHGVTRLQYDSSLMWYAQHLKLLTRVYSHVDERLQEEHEQWSLQVAESRTFAASLAGDSVDLWSLRRHQVLDQYRHTDARYWEIPSDSNFMAGDTLHWHFIVRQLAPGQQLVAAVSLTPVLELDERGNTKPEQRQAPVGYQCRLVTKPGPCRLTVAADSLLPFRVAQLSLVLIQDSTIQSPVFADSITLIRTHVKTTE